MDLTPSQAPLKGSLKEVYAMRRKLLKEKEQLEREREEADRALIEQGFRPPSRQKTPDKPKVVQQPAPRKKAIGEGEGAEALKGDTNLAEGSYTQVLKEYGLTMEHVMRFECLGVAKEAIETLRSLFTSLDKDNGGELSAVELYEALMAFGQKVTDDDVVEMMDEVDADGSGSIDFEEFLTLALPGFRKTKPPKPRDFLVYGCRSAMFDDADGCFENPNEETISSVEMPEQCFVKVGGQSWGGQEEEAGGEAREREKPKRKQFLELRLRFKRNIHDSLARTESASGGTIKLPLVLGADNWVERNYPFENKQAVTGQMGAGILFTAPAPPDPNRFPVPITKLKCVKFPNGPVWEDGEKVDGFRIEAITPQKLQISFDYKYGKYAAFPPPPYDLTLIQSGPGSKIQDLKAVVSARSFMPKWLPFILSCKIPSNDKGDGVEVEIQSDLGELYNLPYDQNVPVFVSVAGPETRVQALREYEGARGREWALDMRSTDISPAIMVLCEFRLMGHSRGLLAKVNREYGEVRLAACFTEQVASSSALQLSHGWLACPPHPHVLPLVAFAGPNISIHPPVKGISGTAFSKIVLGAKYLTSHQRNLIFLTVGMHTAWGLGHMHKHDIWHLDVKPDNLVIEVQGEMGDDYDMRRVRERINVRLADFAHCSCVSGTNLTLRGTPGFWAPEQVHTPSGNQGAGDVADEAVEGEMTVTGGLRGEYWGGLKCRDPPVALDCDMSDRSDSWGWATTILFMMGRLNDMKMMGHSGLLQQLLKEGYTPKLEGMFSYEHQPYLDMLTDDVSNSTAAFKAVEEEKSRFEDAIEKNWIKCEPAWLACQSALDDIDDDDLKQIGYYKRCPNIMRNVIDAAISILMPENKESMEWNTLKELVSSMDFVNQLLNFEKTKGLAATTARIVNKYLQNPTFDPELFTEKNVPAADPSKPGQAFKACYAFGMWVIAINRYHDTRKIVHPIQNDLKQKQRQLDKLLPVLETDRQKLSQYSTLVKNLKKKLHENYRMIVAIMLNFERKDAQQMVAGIIGMEGTLTNQQYFRLLREVHHSVGELALIFRHLSDAMPPREVSEHLKSLREGGSNKPFYSRKDAPFEPDRKHEVSVFQKFAFLGYVERKRTPKDGSEGSRPSTSAAATEQPQQNPAASTGANGQLVSTVGSLTESVQTTTSPLNVETILSLSSADEPVAPNVEALATLVATASRPQSPMQSVSAVGTPVASERPLSSGSRMLKPPMSGGSTPMGSQAGAMRPLSSGSGVHSHGSGQITVFPTVRNALPPPPPVSSGEADVLVLDGDSRDFRGGAAPSLSADSVRSDTMSQGGVPGPATISSSKATLPPPPPPAATEPPKQSALWRKAVISSKMVSRLNRQLVDVPIAGETQQKLPRQHNRSGMINKHFVGVREVGDPFMLAVAWCLQTQPRDRMPMETLCAVLQQLMPGQEWHSCSTVRGRSGKSKPSADADRASTEELNTTPLVAEALLGEDGGFEVLLLLERKGAAMEGEGRLLDARDRYLDAYAAARRMVATDKPRTGMFVVFCRLALSVSRVWMKMDCLKFALEWCEIAEGLLSGAEEEIENEGVRGGRIGAGFLFGGPPTSKHVAAERKDKYSIKQMRAREQTLQTKKLDARLTMHRAELLLAMQVSSDEASTMRKASKCFFEAHGLMQKTWADTNADMSKAMAGMAHVLEVQGRFREARSEYQRALETRGSLLALDSYGGDEFMAGLLESLARVNEVLGRPTIAMAQLERAKHMYIAAAGTDCAGHLGVGKVLHNIGKLHMSQGRFNKADEAFREAFNLTTGFIADQAGPPSRPFNHPGVTTRAADALQVRGHVCASLGRWGQGKHDFRVAMECYAFALTGSNHEKDKIEDFSGFKVAECYLGLGKCQEGAGEGWKAAESYQAGYQLIFQGVGHAKHLQLARISELLGGLFWDLGRHGVAIDWYKSALEVREHLQGSKHLSLTTGLMSMAAILRSRGQLEFAVEMTLRSIRILGNSCGEYNVSTAYCLCDVAVCKYPQLAVDHGVLFEKRQRCLQLQDDAEDRVVAWDKVVAQKAKEVKEIKKKTTIKRVVVRMKEDALQDAKNQHAAAVQGVRQAIQNAENALKEFEAVEVKMLECVAILEEASRIHTMSVPHGAKHWEKQVGRLISNMKSDIAKARQAVEEQVSSKQASSTGTTPRSHPSSSEGNTAQRIEEVQSEIDTLELQKKQLQEKLKELLEGIEGDVLLTPRDAADGKASSRGSRRPSGGALSPHPSHGTLKSALKNRQGDDHSTRPSSPMPGADSRPMSPTVSSRPRSVLKKSSAL